MNKREVSRFNAGMMITAIMSSGREFKLRINCIQRQLDPNSYTLVCIDTAEGGWMGISDVSQVLITGEYADSLKTINAMHDRLFDLANAYLEECGYARFTRTTFNAMYDCIYAGKPMDAIKKLRESVATTRTVEIGLSRYNVGYSDGGFAKYLACENLLGVNITTSLSLKEAKDIVDILMCNL